MSVLLVLAGHAANTTGAPGWLGATRPYANFGVRVFFVISGFLITHLLLRERERTGHIDLGAFYVRRVYRIFPAAYVFIAAVAVIAGARLTWTDVVVAFAYLTNYHAKHAWLFGHLWSLAVEEQFYLLWPFALVTWFGQRRALLIGAIMAGPAFRALMFAAHLRWGLSLDGLDTWFPAVADALATGCLLAAARPILDLHAHRLSRAWMLLVPIITLALVQLHEHDFVGRASYVAYHVLVIPLVNVGVALTIDHCIRRRYALLDSRALVWLGVISYSIYLWQQPFLEPHSSAAWARYPINLVAALLAGVASYCVVERPILRWRAARRELGHDDRRVVADPVVYGDRP